MGIQLRTWRLTFLARRRLAMLHIAPIPFPRRRYANAKAPRRLVRRKTFRYHLEDPQTKVPAETMRNPTSSINNQEDGTAGRIAFSLITLIELKLI